MQISTNNIIVHPEVRKIWKRVTLITSAPNNYILLGELVTDAILMHYVECINSIIEIIIHGANR